MNKEIKSVWNENSNEWIKLINEERIPSRSVTNQAIVETILQHDFHQICDIGCGEGWLVRKLRKHGREANGVDATEKLIEHAWTYKQGDFAIQSFQQIASGAPLIFGPYDAAVLNFCIYEKEGTAPLLKEVMNQLEGPKLLFIQSLHPLSILKLGKPYQDQWLDDSWKGLDGNFSSTHSWYYRTFTGWMKLFHGLAFDVVQVVEPMFPNGEPLSILFTLTKTQADD